MSQREKDLLRSISEVSNVIRRKHRLIKTGRESTEQSLTEFFKPVSEPLKKLTRPRDGVPPPPPLQPRDYSTPRTVKPEPSVGLRKIDDTRSPLSRSESMDSFKSVDDDDYVSFGASKQQSDDSNLELKQEPEEKSETELSAAADDADSSINDVANKSSTSIEEYLRKLRDKNGEMDTNTGVRHLQKGLHIGDSAINFDSDKFEVNGEEYNATEGLLELIFKKNVNEDVPTVHDLEQYWKILNSTSALKKNYVKTNTMRSDKSTKYKNIISKLLLKSKSGRGLPEFLLAHRRPRKIDYIYWDDPNELVERLRLLVSSRAAGNTNHTNEIVSIVEELRESGIIY